MRPWNTPIACRLGVAGLFVFAAALTGCGTASRVLTADAPVVAVASAMPQQSLPRAGTVFASVAPRDAVDVTPAAGAVIEPVAVTEEAAPPPPAPTEVVVAETDVVGAEVDAQDRSSDVTVAQARGRAGRSDKDDYDTEEYDPWEGFNEAMFDFNRKLDRYVLKPVAKGYDHVVPDELQRMIENLFDNLNSFKRLMNSLFQAKWDGAARELSRFMLNSTVGVGGLFDIAKAAQIEKSREDFGQTLGFYGVGPGPYLVLPFQPPYTVRDFAGRLVDSVFDPRTWIPTTWWQSILIEAEERVNDRSLNLELYQGFEETVIDMYSAVRHAYLERRRNLIKE